MLFRSDLDWRDIDDTLPRLRAAIAAAAPEELGHHLLELGRLHVDCRGRPADWTPEDWSELVLGLLGDVPMAERMAFTDIIADVGRLPIDVLLTLMADDILVSRPLHERGRFDDASLLALLDRDDSEPTQLFVARRDGVGEVVTDRLVAAGIPKVWLTLAGNVESRLSFPTFDRFSRLTRAQDAMDRALSTRHDLPYEKIGRAHV